MGSLGAKSQGLELSLTHLLLLHPATPSFGTHRHESPPLDSADDPLELCVPKFKVIQVEHSSGGRVLAYLPEALHLILSTVLMNAVVVIPALGGMWVETGSEVQDNSDRWV